MDKDIREYIHYYLHCKVEWDGDVWEITSVSRGAVSMRCVSSSRARYFHGISLPEGAKPILRKLESMTEEEALRVGKLVLWHTPMKYPDSDFRAYKPSSVLIDISPSCYAVAVDNDWYDEEIRIGFNTGNIWRSRGKERIWNQHEIFHYLLSRGFDLWGLIDAGLAVDKETIKS